MTNFIVINTIGGAKLLNVSNILKGYCVTDIRGRAAIAFRDALGNDIEAIYDTVELRDNAFVTLLNVIGAIRL